MSDFLGRLAARVVAPRRALRPRLHSAFESYESTTVETWTPEAAAPAATPRIRAGTPPPVARQPQPPPATESYDARPEPATVRIEHRDTPPAVETIREVVHERMPSESVTQDESAPVVVERDAAPAPPAPPPRVETQTLLRERRTLERIERLRVRSERAETVRTERLSSPVEITIGRIDVRAVVSTAPPPRQQQRERPQLMSLRDYLARRDERRRG